MIRDDRGTALREIGTLFRVGTLAGVGDGVLLERFVSGRGEAAEAAFSAIVDRHGPMVLRVCRRALKGQDDAEDAFQATFLALLRGARSIRKRDSVASWLHGTALRVSACSRASGARRRAHEARFAALRLFEQPEPEVDDLHAILHEEVERLPDRYRAAIVLCDLEGLSHLEAARRLGWPVGTIKSRVARGRERLKSRLVRRGLTPGVGSIGVVVTREAKAMVSLRLTEATVRLAMGQRMVGAASSAVKLADLFQRSLFMGRLRMMAAGIATFGALAAGATLLAQQGPGERPGGRGSQNAEEFTGPYKVIYSVSNLVKWVPENRDGHRPPVDMKPLIDLITSTAAPGTWKDRDAKGQVKEGRPGVGSITQFDTNLSLIVVQTAEGHAQVKERLDQLARLMSAREQGMNPAGRTVAGQVNADEAVRMGQVSPEAIDRLFNEGTEAYKSADFARAVKRFEEGMRVWTKLIAMDGNYFDEYVTKKGIGLIVKRYIRAKDQLNEPIPKDSPFMGLLDVKFREDGNATIRTANPGSGGNGPQDQLLTAPGSTHMMGMMIDGKPATLMGGGNQPMASMTRMMAGFDKPGDAPAPRAKEAMDAMMGRPPRPKEAMDAMMGRPAGGELADTKSAQHMMMNPKSAAGSANPLNAGGSPGMMSGSTMMGGSSGIASPPGTAASKPPTKPSAPGQVMTSSMMSGYGSLTRPNTETEQRLRAVEEKLDRLIKLLDTPKPDLDKGGLQR